MPILGDDERAYIKLIAETDTFNANSFSNRKAVSAGASKGLDDLRRTRPSVVPVRRCDELFYCCVAEVIPIRNQRPRSSVGLEHRLPKPAVACSSQAGDILFPAYFLFPEKS